MRFGEFWFCTCKFGRLLCVPCGGVPKCSLVTQYEPTRRKWEVLKVKLVGAGTAGLISHVCIYICMYVCLPAILWEYLYIQHSSMFFYNYTYICKAVYIPLSYGMVIFGPPYPSVCLLRNYKDLHMQSCINFTLHDIYIPYGRKFWREDILADCSKYVIWQNLLCRWLSQFSHNDIHNKMAKFPAIRYA